MLLLLDSMTTSHHVKSVGICPRPVNAPLSPNAFCATSRHPPATLPSGSASRAIAARAEPATVDARAIVALVEHSVLAQLREEPLARGAARVEVAAGALDLERLGAFSARRFDTEARRSSGYY